MAADPEEAGTSGHETPPAVRSALRPIVARCRSIGSDDATSQLAWSIAAQGLSSVTNFGLVAILAISAGPAEFGRLMATVSVYLLALAITRALFCEPMVASGANDSDRASLTGRLWKAGGVGALATALVGSLVGLSLSIAVVVAVSVPLLLQQDGQRYLAWVEGARSTVATLDLIWLAVSSLVLVVTTWLDRALSVGPGLDWRPLPGLIVVAWAAGGVTSWIVALDAVADQPGQPASVDDIVVDVVVVNASPSDRNTDRPSNLEHGATVGARDHRHRDLGSSQAIMAVAVNLGPVLVALVLNPEVTAAVKALLVPFAPVLSLAAGIRLVTLPKLESLFGRSASGLRHPPSPAATRQAVGLVAQAGAAAALAASFGAVVVALLPASLIGPTFGLVEPYLPIGVAICVLHVVAQQMGDAVALAGRMTVVDRRVVSVCTEWLGLIIGALVAGTGGLVVGWLIGLTAGSAVWAIAWWRSVAEPVEVAGVLNPTA